MHHLFHSITLSSPISDLGKLSLRGIQEFTHENQSLGTESLNPDFLNPEDSLVSSSAIQMYIYLRVTHTKHRNQTGDQMSS